jgi:hypothetical protein
MVMIRKEKRPKDLVKMPQSKRSIRRKISFLTLLKEMPKLCLMIAKF